MMPVHRHQLARLSDAGWHAVLARAWDEQARDCLSHWAARRLPLVVTRQLRCAPSDAGGHTENIAMGLPAPLRWGRRRIALTVPRADISYFDEFARAESIVDLLPARLRSDWRGLCAVLAACGATARVYGSYGWQKLSGLDCVQRTSDIDLWLAVSDPLQADRVSTTLQDFDHCAAPRLDGELLFANGDAVSWREWLHWRAGRGSCLLVKRVDGPILRRSAAVEEALA